MATGSRTKSAKIAKHIAREYESIVLAIQSLERALTSAAPTREVAWRQEVRHALANVVGLVQEHCETADNTGGLLYEVEQAIGRPRGLSHARREHERLSKDAVGLLAAIRSDKNTSKLTYQEVRQRGWDLIDRLRKHQAREADLLVEFRERDTGALD